MEKNVTIIPEAEYQKIKQKIGKKDDAFTLEDLKEAGYLYSCLDIG